jgi:hypothetical protein
VANHPSLVAKEKVLALKRKRQVKQSGNILK